MTKKIINDLKLCLLNHNTLSYKEIMARFVGSDNQYSCSTKVGLSRDISTVDGIYIDTSFIFNGEKIVGAVALLKVGEEFGLLIKNDIYLIGSQILNVSITRRFLFWCYFKLEISEHCVLETTFFDFFWTNLDRLYTADYYGFYFEVYWWLKVQKKHKFFEFLKLSGNDRRSK